MNILHITLGNPKVHSGGLNRYCVDLMNEQMNQGHDVKVLYAGTYFPWRKVRIRKQTTNLFSISGALPVAITYGIDRPERYMLATTVDVYICWLKEISPEIIHVHSFMGIHKEFFIAARILKIPMIFTTHDYYPCCFRCNLVDRDNKLCEMPFDAERCMRCNCNAGLSAKTQVFIQSEIYQKVRKWKLIKFLKRNYAKKGEIAQKSEIKMEDKNGTCKDFSNLRMYYLEILEMMSKVHCNSRLTMQIYKKYFPNLEYDVLPITHSNIERTYHLREYDNLLRISYLGGMNQYKGFCQLKKVLHHLEDTEGWECSLYGGEYNEVFNDNRIVIKGFFSREDEAEVWNNTDLLIVPSQCPETFGFVVLEALARRIPVICSNLVGAGYLLDGLESECIYYYDNDFGLLTLIKKFLECDYYSKVQKKIEGLVLPISMVKHCEDVLNGPLSRFSTN